MPSLIASLQAPIQALLRPSLWLPCYHRLHSHVELWKVDAPPSEFVTFLINAVRSVIKQSDNTETFDIHTISEDKTFVRLFAFTRAEWLDVVEIQHCHDGLYEVRSFSSGLFPLAIPFACVINLGMFWVPFYDNKFNRQRLQRIKDAMEITVNLNQ